MDLSEKDDNQLINDYFKGDKKSLDFLIERYLPQIYAFIFRIVGVAGDAEDLVQETFIRFWRNIKKFDRTKKIKPWLYVIAKNTTYDFLRKKRAIPLSEFEDEAGENYLAETLADVEPLPNEIAARAETASLLTNAISELPPKYGAIISLRYTGGFSLVEIAEMLEMPINTVKSQNQRALKMLRAKIAPKNK